MKIKLRKIYLLIRAIPKSLYFNLKYLKLNQAIKLPFIVSHRVKIESSTGKIKIDNNKISLGMIKIGFNNVPIFDQHRSRTIWYHKGNLVFRGKCTIGHGSKIYIGEYGKLIFGQETIINAESTIVCNKNVVFGDRSLLSWDILVMDSDWHKIKDEFGKIINSDNEIIIGNNVWIGCRSVILKGAIISDNNVVAANSTITANSVLISDTNQVIGGNPNRVLIKNITWEM